MNILRIGICDDDKQMLRLIEAQVRGAFNNYSNQVEITITSFDVARNFIESCKENAFDLILLDIEMPENNGYDVATEINSFCLNTYLVFVSCHENYVNNSFCYNARNFIRKSKLENDVRRTIKKYMKDTVIKRISYMVSDGTEEEEVFAEDIYYIESNAHYIMIKTNAKKYNMNRSIGSMEEELSIYGFLRVHRSYLVNRMYIKKIKKIGIELIDGSLVAMSRGKKKKIEEEMIRYDRRI